MAYIIQPTVKSSLDIGGKVVTWNEQEVNKLIKEKEEFLATEKVREEIEEIEEIQSETQQVQESKEVEEVETRSRRKGQVKKYE